MSDETQNVPQTWADVVKANKAQQEALLAALNNGPSFISFQGGAITIDGVEMPNNEVEVIVVSFVGENSYYNKPYDPTNPASPVCYALYDGLSPARPSDEATIKVSPLCDGCPMKEWGSNPNGRGGKACSDHVRVAVLPADVASADEVASTPARYAKVPTMSVELFQQYVKTVDVTTGLPPFAFKTTLKTVRDPKTQFKVHWLFDRSKAITDESILMALFTRKQQLDRDILFGYPKMDTDEATAAQPRRSKV